MCKKRVDKLVDKLLEVQGPWDEYTAKKPFPMRVTTHQRKIPGPIVKSAEKGEKWVAYVHADDAPFPPEMFAYIQQKIAPNHVTGTQSLPKFLGWIGGTYSAGQTYYECSKCGRVETVDKVEDRLGSEEYVKLAAKGKGSVPCRCGESEMAQKGSYGAVFVHEIQSDIMQRTYEFMTKEARFSLILSKPSSSFAQYEQVKKELEGLKQQYKKLDPQSSLTGAVLKKKLELEEKIGEVESKLEGLLRQAQKDLDQYKHRPPGGGEWAKYKSKFVNYFSRWVDAFVNTAIEFSRKQEATFLCIVTAAALGHAGELFKRAYDRAAKKYGFQPHPSKKEWWVAQVSKLQLRERKRFPTKTALIEEIEGGQWKAHIDTYFRVLAKEMGMDLSGEGGDYARSEFVGEIFRMWTDQVQDELKQNETFRNEVAAYVTEKYNTEVDPAWWGLDTYGGEEEDGETEVTDEEFWNMIKDIDVSSFEDI